MSSLPPLKKIALDEDGASMWPLLLRAEKAALDTTRTASAKYNDNLICIRVLAFFLLDFWDHQMHGFGIIPYKCLLHEIKSCNSTDAIVGSDLETQTQEMKVIELGLRYWKYLMRVFRSDGRPLPSYSHHTSYPPIEIHMENTVDEMGEAPKSTENIKNDALMRDGWKCMLTGAYDVDSLDKFPDIVTESSAEVVTQVAHLFSESMQDDNKPIEYTATIFTMLEMFGLDGVAEDLHGSGANRLSNVLTMSSGLHQQFDRFKFWLEPVPGEPHTYDVCAHNEIRFFNLLDAPLRRVTFRIDPATAAICAKKNVPLPDLPSQSLIAIRAACARVAHMSGAADQIEQILSDREEIDQLAIDGSSAGLLSSLLLARKC